MEFNYLLWFTLSKMQNLLVATEYCWKKMYYDVAYYDVAISEYWKLDFIS